MAMRSVCEGYAYAYHSDREITVDEARGGGPAGWQVPPWCNLRYRNLCYRSNMRYVALPAR